MFIKHNYVDIKHLIISCISIVRNPSLQMANVPYFRTSEAAFPLAKEISFAVGYPLRSAYGHVIPSHKMAVIETNIALFLPKNTIGQVYPRQELAFIYGIDVCSTVIVPDQIGVVSVLLFNHGCKDFIIQPGDAIANIVFLHAQPVDVHEVAKPPKETPCALLQTHSSMQERKGSFMPDPRLIKMAPQSIIPPYVSYNRVEPRNVNPLPSSVIIKREVESPEVVIDE